MHLVKFAVVVVVWMAGSALAQVPPTPQVPQMVLAFGPQIDAPDGGQCQLDMVRPDYVTHRLTEVDVIGWHATHGRMALDPARFTARPTTQSPPHASVSELMDRCFSLTIDGKTLTIGLALSVNSHWITGYNTLNVIERDGVVEFQLTSSSHGRHMRLIHLDALHAVLAHPANLARWHTRATGPEQYEAMGKAWSNAVRHLIDQKVIQSGIPIADVVAQLGEPTRTKAGEDDTMRYQWYFDTPRHVNPMFTLATERGKVTTYRLEQR